MPFELDREKRRPPYSMHLDLSDFSSLRRLHSETGRNLLIVFRNIKVARPPRFFDHHHHHHQHQKYHGPTDGSLAA